VFDNGYIEIDPAQCGYTTFLGAAVPEPETGRERVGETGGGSDGGEEEGARNSPVTIQNNQTVYGGVDR